MRLRILADLFRQKCVGKTLKYTKYVCGFTPFSDEKSLAKLSWRFVRCYPRYYPRCYNFLKRLEGEYRMAKKTGSPGASTKAAAKSRQSSAPKSSRKHEPEPEDYQSRSSLTARIVSALVMTFLALFLLLSMVGVHAAMLDALRKCVQGLFGYGFYLLPFALGYLSWILVFRNHEPFRARILGLTGIVISFSALLHVILCYAGLEKGIKLIGSLWRTGMSGASGGVIPGLLALGLVKLVSKMGAIPVFLVLLIVSIFPAFRLSAATLIHKRAEKRREQLEELEPQPEPQPITQEMTMEDLRTLATPPAWVRKTGDGGVFSGLKKKTGVDSPFDDDEDAAPSQPKIRRAKILREDEPERDDDFLFLGGGKPEKRPKKQKAASQDPFEALMEEDYTAQVQSLVQNADPIPEPEPQDDWMTPEPPAQPDAVPETLTDADIAQGAETAAKKGKVTSDQAAQAAEQVAREIEARTDAEAEEEITPPYQYPPMTMLSEALGSKEDNTEEMRTNVLRLEETFKSFNVDIKIENVVRGPTVTRYEMELRPGVKMSKITSLHEDIALALGVSGVRVAAVPGKSSIIGIEVPNRITTSVPIREVLSSREFQKNESPLAFTVGKDIGGNYIIGDIAKMPHLLIAGTTGSGKSVCMNSIIVSLLYRATPEQVRLIMIDPKMVELSIYNGIPHLLIPVVTDAKKAAGALQWAVTEMERRYQLLADYKVRDLKGYNKLARRDDSMTPMPQIVIIIDELADLMLVAAKEVENSIVRIAQKARAAGMHLVIATQRPSTNVITGIMKANIPSRIAFAVASAIDSRIILDEGGAEKLVGKGDMLYAPLGAGKPTRVQGCFITDEEAEEVAEFVKTSSESDYSDEILREIEQNVSASGGKDSGGDPDQTAMTLDGDPLLPDAVEVVLDTGQASTSMLQRRLKLGYAHAARIVDELEEKGIVGPFEGSKARQVLITRDQWDTMVGLNPKAKAPEEAADPEGEGTEPADDCPFDED